MSENRNGNTDKLVKQRSLGSVEVSFQALSLKKKIRSKFGQNGGKYLVSAASPMSPQSAGVPDANTIGGAVIGEVTATASQI